MLISKGIIGAVLFYASWEDLSTMTVHDKVFIAGLLGAVITGAYSQGLTFAGSMLVQGLIAGVIGTIMHFAGRFGGADIWTLILACSVYPDKLIFGPLAFLLVSMVVWIKAWNILTVFNKGSSEGAPAIPGLFIGYLLMLSFYGI